MYLERIKVAYERGGIVIIFIYFVITFSILARFGAQELSIKAPNGTREPCFDVVFFLLHGCTHSATFFIASQKRAA